MDGTTSRHAHNQKAAKQLSLGAVWWQMCQAFVRKRIGTFANKRACQAFPRFRGNEIYFRFRGNENLLRSLLRRNVSNLLRRTVSLVAGAYTSAG
eukprot:22083_6